MERQWVPIARLLAPGRPDEKLKEVGVDALLDVWTVAALRGAGRRPERPGVVYSYGMTRDGVISAAFRRERPAEWHKKADWVDDWEKVRSLAEEGGVAEMLDALFFGVPLVDVLGGEYDGGV